MFENLWEFEGVEKSRWESIRFSMQTNLTQFISTRLSLLRCCVCYSTTIFFFWQFLIMGPAGALLVTYTSITLHHSKQLSSLSTNQKSWKRTWRWRWGVLVVSVECGSPAWGGAACDAGHAQTILHTPENSFFPLIASLKAYLIKQTCEVVVTLTKTPKRRVDQNTFSLNFIGSPNYYPMA